MSEIFIQAQKGMNLLYSHADLYISKGKGEEKEQHAILHRENNPQQ